MKTGAEIKIDSVLVYFRISRSAQKNILFSQNSDLLYWTRPEVNPTSTNTWGSEQLTQLLPTDSLIRFGVKWEGRVNPSPPQNMYMNTVVYSCKMLPVF